MGDFSDVANNLNDVLSSGPRTAGITTFENWDFPGVSVHHNVDLATKLMLTAQCSRMSADKARTQFFSATSQGGWIIKAQGHELVALPTRPNKGNFENCFNLVKESVLEGRMFMLRGVLATIRQFGLPWLLATNDHVRRYLLDELFTIYQYIMVLQMEGNSAHTKMLGSYFVFYLDRYSQTFRVLSDWYRSNSRPCVRFSSEIR